MPPEVSVEQEPPLFAAMQRADERAVAGDGDGGDAVVQLLKILRQMTGGPEFFETTDNSDLALRRTRLLVGGMAFAGEKERERLLARADDAEPVREVVEKVLVNPSFLHEELLGHLTESRNRWYQYGSRSRSRDCGLPSTAPI